jgi:hypothetical protein
MINKTKKVKITTYITKGQGSDLKLLADKLDMSQGFIVRQALKEYIKKLKRQV